MLIALADSGGGKKKLKNYKNWCEGKYLLPFKLCQCAPCTKNDKSTPYFTCLSKQMSNASSYLQKINVLLAADALLNGIASLMIDSWITVINLYIISHVPCPSVYSICES